MTTSLARRISELERKTGLGQANHALVESLDPADQVFYRRMLRREAVHPRGFEGLVRELTREELLRLLDIYAKTISEAGLAGSALEEIRDLCGHLADRRATV